MPSIVKFSNEYFLLIGRSEAWKNLDKEVRIEEIYKEILPLYGEEDILEIIKNYILGYKIGKLEILLSKCEDIVCFDFDTCEFEKLDNDDISTTSFEKAYSHFIKKLH